MRLDVGDHVQVARDATARTGLALAREPDLVAIVDARRDGHAERPLELRAPLASTHRAGLLDDPARHPGSGRRR